MKEAIKFTKEVMDLTSNVKGLLKDVGKLETICADHEKRIIGLEADGPRIEEMAKRVALEQVLNSFHQLSSDVMEIKKRLPNGDGTHSLNSPDTHENSISK